MTETKRPRRIRLDVPAVSENELQRLNKIYNDAMNLVAHTTRASREMASLAGVSLLVPDLAWLDAARFNLPTSKELSRFLQHADALPTVAQRYSLDLEAMQTAVQKMTVPWLDYANTAGSVAGLAKLHGIGDALFSMPPFSQQLASALRVDLGDWRSEIDWMSEIATDPSVRMALYLEQGLDPDLARFPSPVYAETLEKRNQDGPWGDLDDNYAEKPAGDSELQEAAFVRANRAHNRIQRFETRVRRFIADCLETAFGPTWMKCQLPPGFLQEWREKKSQESASSNTPLIDYADFTDYLPIIVRRDNWDSVFKAYFKRKTTIEESFRRLYPIRLCAMHSRPVTSTDELYLYVETSRILTSMGVRA